MKKKGKNWERQKPPNREEEERDLKKADISYFFKWGKNAGKEQERKPVTPHQRVF